LAEARSDLTAWLARKYVVQGVTEDMDITAPPGGCRQDLTNRCLKPCMIVEDHQLLAVKPARLESAQKFAL
jgi:hypothetical protein